VEAGRPSEPERSYWGRFVRSRAAWLAVVAVAFVYQLPFFDRWFSFMDEGHILLYADIIASGGELYRDATVYPLPGAFYFLAWIFQLVEPSNLVARWILVVEFALLVGLVFLLMRRLVPPGWVLASAALLLLYRIWAFPHWHMYSYSSTALLLQFGALLVVIRFTESGDRRLLLLAGFIFGVGVFCKQDYGAAALLAIAATLLVYARSNPEPAGASFWRLGGWFIAPAVVVGAATALHFLGKGLFGEFIQFTVLNHFVGMASYEYPSFPSLLPLFAQDPQLRSGTGMESYMPAIVHTFDLSLLTESAFYRETALYDVAVKAYFFAPYPFLAFGALRLWWRRRALRDPGARPAALAEFALWAFAAAFVALVALNRPQDYAHLVVLYWPLLCLGLVYVRALLRGRRPLAWVLAALLALPAGAAVAYTGSLAWRLRTHHSAPIESDRAGIHVTPKQAKLVNEILAYLETHTDPGEPVAVMPYFPILHFYADRPGPHRASYIVWPFPELPDRDRRVIEGLEATGTNVLLYNLNQFLVFELMAEYAPELFAHLVEHFETDRIFSYQWLGYRMAAARRVERAAPGRPLLPPDGNGLTLSIQSRSAAPRPIPPEEQGDHFSETLWPFRPVIALRPAREGRTVLSIPAELPPGARLRTAIAVHPSRWDHEASVSFELAVSDGEHRERLYERTLRPTWHFDDRGWFEVDVPVDAWVGRPVRVELSTQTGAPAGEHLLMGGWAEPRVVIPAEEPARSHAVNR